MSTKHPMTTLDPVDWEHVTHTVWTALALDAIAAGSSDVEAVAAVLHRLSADMINTGVPESATPETDDATTAEQRTAARLTLLEREE